MLRAYCSVGSTSWLLNKETGQLFTLIVGSIRFVWSGLEFLCRAVLGWSGRSLMVIKKTVQILGSNCWWRLNQKLCDDAVESDFIYLYFFFFLMHTLYKEINCHFELDAFVSHFRMLVQKELNSGQVVIILNFYDQMRLVSSD